MKAIACLIQEGVKLPSLKTPAVFIAVELKRHMSRDGSKEWTERNFNSLVETRDISVFSPNTRLTLKHSSGTDMFQKDDRGSGVEGW